MKKISFLLLVVALPFISNAQTQTCTFIPNLQNWTWNNWPVAVNFEATVEYDTTGMNIQVPAPASVDLLLKQPSGNDTVHYGSFTVTMLPSGAFKLTGSITPSGEFVFSGPFEIGAFAVFFNPEHLSEVTYILVSELILIEPPIVTGVDTHEKPVFNIFPNPAREFITVTTGEKEVAIYNLLGNKVAVIATNKLTDIAFLPTGQYYVQNEGKTKKFVVQK